MSKVKSEEIDCRLEAISILKAAKKQSSEVYRNDLVAQWLERGKGQSDPKQ